MAKILVKFPTRSRPGAALQVLKLWEERLSKKHDVEFAVSLDTSDPNHERVAQTLLSTPRSVQLRVDAADNKTRVEAVNYNADAGDWDLIIVGSDDVVPLEGYDDKIAQETAPAEAALFPAGAKTILTIGAERFRKKGYLIHPDYLTFFGEEENAVHKAAHVFDTFAGPDNLSKRNRVSYARDLQVFDERKAKKFPKKSVLQKLPKSVPSFDTIPLELVTSILEKRSDIKTFVETGTYKGDTLHAISPLFGRLFSVELSRALFDAAFRRLSLATKIVLFHGSSTTMLPGMLEQASGPSLIWLDAHYSGGVTARESSRRESPILQELRLIRASGGKHVVLIDDIADFKGKKGYPTKKALRSHIRTLWPHAGIAEHALARGIWQIDI